MQNEIDPVCGMQVDPSDASGQSDYQGRTYYFCSDSCKSQFDSDPRQFTQERGESAGGAR